ncbi:LytR/AlgR family response regulator transcription factor [Chondrinema litorale]|uniref:LytR/AlgR family response regulator transcription factor n=1 Tax=Chondrinema litorale TaxID=2994555 RepID=UPI0025426FF5|nr:LytTR family transcriptional regulator DNA-binding domain-containing protein [Chondrinema litorale]UZR95166.1 LytTR family transcriptional regulator DNA-binding domain-containing protein [Chondrinema litorale]
MRAIIVDDERLARKELNSLLEEYNDIEIVAEASNADEAADVIESLNPDVLFLDIQMPEKTGFDLLEMLTTVPKVIFTTAYDDFALKAFEINAFDYLLKPIDPKRLEETVKKLSDYLAKEEKGKSENKKTESNETDKLLGTDQVFVKDGEKCWFVKLADIRLFESDGNYVKVYFDTFRPLIHRSLNALDERLDDKMFFRASRKYIINLKWIEKIEPWFNGGLMVSLKGGQKIEISRRQAAKFKDKLSL